MSLFVLAFKDWNQVGDRDLHEAKFPKICLQLYRFEITDKNQK